MSKPGNMGISPERLQTVRDWQDADPGRAFLPHREAAKELHLPESAVRRARATIAQGTAMTTLALDQITIDPTLQLRADLDRLQTEQYAERYRESLPMPPVVVFHDAGVYRLADGHQRHGGARLAGLAEIAAEVREGDYLAALSYAAGANAAHGVNRTNADKAKAVAAILARPEFAGKSDREVARLCCVSHPFVKAVRDRANPPAPTPDPVPDPAPAAGDAEARPTPPASAPSPGNISSGPPAENPFDPKPEPDGEWLAGFRVRSDLSDRCRAIFDRSAIAWRRVTGHERFKAFADLVEKHTPSTGPVGYERMIRKSLRTKGPDRWLLCSKCGGKGHGETAAPCENCFGDGFKLTF